MANFKPGIQTDSKGNEYTTRETRDYHNKMSKPGATQERKRKDGTVEIVELTDFERGQHFQKGKELTGHMARAARKHKKAKK